MIMIFGVDDYEKSLWQLVFPNYKMLDEFNTAYLDFFHTIMTVIDKMAVFKTKRVKGNTHKWFDYEFLEKLNSRDKVFHKFKRSRLHIDRVIWESEIWGAETVCNKKSRFYLKKKSQKVLANQESYEGSLKYLGMPNRTLISNFHVMEDNDL